MKKILNFIKSDFNSVRIGWEQLVKKEIPFGIIFIYYILTLPIGLLLLPFAYLYSKHLERKLIKMIDGNMEEA